MADVRSLLRSELASRKGTSQTATSATNTPNRVTKKRKVDPADSATRKRVKQTDPEQILANEQVSVRPPAAQVVAGGDDDDDVGVESSDAIRTVSNTTAAQAQVQVQLPERQTAQPPSAIPPSEPTQQPQPTAAVDEDEWAAFEREVAAPTRIQPQPFKPAAISAAATISAAPISAEELAALQEKEQNDARQNREAEAEGEREDAARFLEEEFDEMEQLEERVRRLKNMREQLRAKQRSESVEVEEGRAVSANTKSNTGEVKTDAKNAEDEEDDEDDDDDWDNWRFR